VTSVEGGDPAPSPSRAEVRSLLASQHPDLADLPLVAVDGGRDNTTWRLGDALAVRLPRHARAAAMLERERAWLPQVLGEVPDAAAGGLDASPHLRPGRAATAFAWPWAIGRWHSGGPAASTPPADEADAAVRLGTFLAGLHVPAPDDAPDNPWRGGPLDLRSALFDEQVDTIEASGRALGPGVTAAAVRQRWAELVDTPAATAPATWVHGDLHLANLLVADGRLRAVIDFGYLTRGDRAHDLSVAWALFTDVAARDRFRDAAGAVLAVDDATWHRAAARSLARGVSHLAGAPSTEAMAAVARRQIAAVLAD
jgi:aminoglycoside phosphotransferase (APT) family kinase protein